MTRPAYRARLIAARKRLGTTPERMARRLLTSPRIYTAWETGAISTPGVAVAAAEALAPAKDTIVALVGRLTDGSRTSRQIAEHLGLTIAQVKMARRVLRQRYGLNAAIMTTGGRNVTYSDAIVMRVAELIESGASARAASIQVIGHYSRSVADRATAIIPSSFRGRPPQLGDRQ